MNRSLKTRAISMVLAVLMIIGVLPMTAMATETAQKAASDFDTTVSDGYYNVISSDTYNLAPGAIEKEIILNNGDGTDRKVVHVFEVDATNEQIQVVPGYYGIDKLNPEDLAGDAAIWKAEQLTKTVAYYEDTLGLNVVGAMNTALAYDSNAPYGYMVWNGVVLGTPEVHKGAQTYLAIYQDGTAELRSMSTPLNGNEWTAISANFGWLVKDGKLTSTSVERTSSDASRSMIGIKADGTLVFCQVDGRNAPVSTGLSNYEMGEMMLSLGCVNAVNCDGGGSSTFVSKREGTDENVMRSVPSDGSERPTINSVMIVSTAMPTGVFHHAVLESAYGYIAPGASMEITAAGVDTNGYPMDVPADVTWKLADESMGSVEDGVFTAGETTGEAAVHMMYAGQIVGELVLKIVHPESFGFTADSTVIPYGKSVELEVVASYGVDDWAVCVDGAYELTLSDENAGYLDGSILCATSDETVKGVDVTVTYLPDTTITDVIAVSYGKGSEILFDFEDGSVDGWMGFAEAKQWSIDNGVNNTLVGSSPLAGQFSSNLGSTTFLSSEEIGGKVKNGEYALAWSLDNTTADFAGWSYNVLFYIGEQIVLRDVANGQNATKLGMWLYIPENAPGLAFQSQLYAETDTGSLTCKQSHFTFTTASGAVKNLNSCTEADIPESRWVYASIDLTTYDFITTPKADDTSNSRSPSIIRTYVKPTEPAVITFYIDDITLDYSDAVDDRILPVVSDVAYTGADESKELTEGAVISGESISFSAKVSDNAGLNNATAVISVDGNAMATTVSGGVMACDGVKLNPGVHTVTYEIQDKLGNLGKVTRTFTVAGDAVVTLSGHNDSGAPAEYDSIYYADVNVADIASVDTLTTTIYLQTANTWEPEGIRVAEGFEAAYSLNECTNELTITVKRVGETALTGAQTLVSLPIRLWSWNCVDGITGEPITPEKQFATGYCPIVQIRCEVVYGSITFVDETTAPFGGSMTVETNLNDNVNPWHYHDAELTVLNQAATCTEAGYEGRTYCETCQSVIDWGTVIEATGHIYEDVDGVLTCVCGELFNGELNGKTYVDGIAANGWIGESYFVDGVMLTGVQIVDECYYDFGEDGICKNQAKINGIFSYEGKLYCAIAGKLVSGWQAVDGGWCYADPTTFLVATGEYKVSGLTYTFDENGVLVKGAWYTNSTGTKYSYGPAFYKREWAEIDGERYYFGEDSYMYTGVRFIAVNRNNPKEGWRVYTFAEDGKLLDEMLDANGIITSEVDGMFWVVDGTSVYGGLMLIDGDYYYARTSGELVVNRTYWITKTNDLLPEANYTFGADGKMINPPITEEPDPEEPIVPEVKNGIISEDGKLWWYVDGVKTYGGLMLIDGSYYYARSSGQILTSCTYWITKTNDLLPAANYTFGEDGKMIDPPVTEEPDPEQPEQPEVPEVKNGIISEDGKLWWYVDGVKTYGGLMLIDGSYYYARSSGEILTNRTYWITKTNDLLPAANYTFGEDGKMIDPPATEEPDQGETEEPETPVVKNGIISEDGKLWWYVDGVKTYGGLMLIDGDYYYARSSGEILTNRTYWITKTNDLLPAANYTFGEDGKMVNPPV